MAGRLYKVVFQTKEYFERTGNRKCFYPWVEVSAISFRLVNLALLTIVVKIPFEVANPNEHYHIPLLLSPYAYTTYRGS